jgi:D-alanyl-D-alanine carboxypeptidase/D-alanyl-D-alanine-endopeptidase (penicillin-binding protein 4)
VIGLAGCGGSGHTARQPPAHRSAAPALQAAVAPAPLARPRLTRSPALRHLQAVLVTTMRIAGPRTGALVVDLGSGATLFSLRAGVARPPASLEKLFTSVALLRLLGPAARLHTTVLATGRLSAGGVWRGNLYLRGDGDPTFGDGWYDHVYEAGQGATVTDLVDQLRRLGIRRLAGQIYGDASRFDSAPGGPATGGAPDTPDYGGELSALVFDHGASSARLSPPAFAAHELALTLRSQHVFALAAGRPARAPAAARTLASVSSPRLTSLLKLMDVPSDDLFADLLTKQLGYHFQGRGTLAAGAGEIQQAIAGGYGLRPRILDGSGLDKSDRTSPAQVVSLLRQVQAGPLGRLVDSALPVTGVSGTVQGIGAGTPARGRCSAKTGTLNYVSNLAGVCRTRSGRRLAFAIFLDGPPNWQAYPLLGRMVGAIAGY